MSLKTPPVLFLFFNRPTTTQTVFESIRGARPEQLYLACDGPRKGHPEDAANLAACKKICDAIDWPCSVERLYRNKNLGCRNAIQQAVDWFFENVPQGIVLEDDCFPHPNFFTYCQNHLEQYRDDPAIATICGTSMLGPESNAEGSGIRSKFFNCWGWAGWRESWQKIRGHDHQDYSENLLPEMSKELSRYYRKLDEICARESNQSWAYEVSLSSLQLGLRHILPPVNMVINLGFTQQSTHTERRPPHAPKSFGLIEKLDLTQPLCEQDVNSEKAFLSTQFQPLHSRLVNRIRYSRLIRP